MRLYASRAWNFLLRQLARLFRTDFLMYALILLFVTGLQDEFDFREKVASRSAANYQWVADRAALEPGKEICSKWGPIEHKFLFGLIRLPSESGNDCMNEPGLDPTMLKPEPTATYLP